MSRIITQADLYGCTLTDLQALYHTLQHELVLSEAGSQARRNALASLDAVSLAMARRHMRGPGL
jgi:hypothetical protein